jgi:thiol-disulfide isomerase/thioredoxin
VTGRTALARGRWSLVLALLLAAGAVPAGAAPVEAGEAPPPGVAAGKPADGGKAGFQVVDVEGLKGLLRRQRGRVVLLHFWASWCYPCLQELPLIDKFAREVRPRGVELLSISLDDPARMGPRVAALLRKSAPHLTPNIVQFGDADELIGAVDPRWAGAIPALFAYDQRGQLRGNLIGTASRPELDALVAGLLKAAAADGAPAPEPTPASPPAARK